jgi:dienelactone hydrolase
MQFLKLGLTMLLTTITLSAQAADNEGSKIKGEEIIYSAGDTKLTGYLAYNASAREQRPGVIIVHEWWGHNDYVRQRAEQLAAMGYTALALDMYGNGKQAEHPQDARAFMMESFNNMNRSEERFVAAKQLLENHPTTINNKIAAIGYCFGGGIVLQMARNGLDLRGVASFHGNLATHPNPAKLGGVKAKILVMHGADDPLIPAEQVEAFKREMQQAKVEYKFIAYPGAVHAFTNQAATRLGQQFDLPLAYNAQADQESWQVLTGFLTEVFKAE